MIIIVLSTHNKKKKKKNDNTLASVRWTKRCTSIGCSGQRARAACRTRIASAAFLLSLLLLRTSLPFCDAVSRVPVRRTPNQGAHIGKREDPTLGHGIKICLRGLRSPRTPVTTPMAEHIIRWKMPLKIHNDF